MSGHSKWSTIKRQKGANDSKRAQIFTKLARAITVAARKGGGDPSSNPTLRLAVEKARSSNMPKDNIERAIAKATGAGSESARLEELRYEGYGPCGVAILVDCLTDNRNRTASEIRNIFSKHGGSLGETGSAAYVFAGDPENPTFTIPITNAEDSKALLDLLEALDDHDDVQDVYSNAEFSTNS